MKALEHMRGVYRAEVFMKKIVFALLGACVVFGSCSTGDTASAVSKIFGGSSQAPVFLNCRAVSEDEVEFEFSHPVTVKSLSFEPALEVASIEDGVIVKVKLEGNLPPGLQYTADLLAEDADRNTINVLVPFRSRNNNMPKLVINELCTEYYNATAGKKTEFIEFRMKSAGNLGAMRVFIHGNTKAAKQTIYEFLPVEVKEDELVVLHLRTYYETCIDEYGVSLEESTAIDSSPNARDFWMPGDNKLMHKAATAVYVLDQDGRVLDAVMISATANSWWEQDYLAEAAEFLFQQGAWKSTDGKIASPADSVISANSTNGQTVCRDETVEDSNSAADWYIVKRSGATPGNNNNPERLK
jgi:hypothetical protein